MIMLRKLRRCGLKFLSCIDELPREYIKRKLLKGHPTVLGMQNRIHFISFYEVFYKVFYAITMHNIYPTLISL
jgi:hypothetical protein